MINETKEHNKAVEKMKIEFMRLISAAGFQSVKEFAQCEELGLKYAGVSKWGNEIYKAGNQQGKIRPFPKWVFSWLELYIKEKNNNFRNDQDLLSENIQLKEKFRTIYGIINE